MDDPDWLVFCSLVTYKLLIVMPDSGLTYANPPVERQERRGIN
jgi:hypothetical protein